MTHTPHEMMSDATKEATATELRVGQKFELEELDAKGWAVRIHWTPRGKRTGQSVRLYEPARGKIMIDYGSRDAGGRKSTGTSDRQAAIWYAEEQLKMMVVEDTREDEDGRDLYDELADAEGNPPLWDLFNLYLKERPASNRPGAGVSPKWHKYILRVRDIVALLFGRDFSALDADQSFATEYVEARTTEDLDFGGARQTLYARDCSKQSAGKELRVVYTVLEHGRRKMLRSHQRPVLAYNPLSVKALPAPSQGAGKRAITMAMHSLLVMPIPRDDEGYDPAPLDQVDPVGRARIIWCLKYHHGGRKGAYTVDTYSRGRKPGMRRKDLAITPQEVRDLLRRMEAAGAFGVKVEMAEYFPHGVLAYWWENDKEGCRSDQEPMEWWRIYPLSEDMRAEFDLYHRRTEEHYGRKEDGGLGGVYDWHPDAPLFRDTLDPSQPLRSNPMFRSTQYVRARGGEPNYTPSGAETVAKPGDHLRDETGERRVRSQGGWFRQAQMIVRAQARANGQDPEEVMPIFPGELAHGARAGWTQRIEEYGWVTRVETEDGPADLNRHVLYLEGRKMPPTPRVRNYMVLWPEILMGIAEYRHRDDVLAEREREAVQDARATVDAIARMRDIAYGGRPNLKVVEGGA